MSTVGLASGPFASPQDFTAGGGVSKVVGLVASQQISRGPGRLMKCIVTATGTGSWAFFDAVGAEGSAMHAIPASAVVGQIYDVRIPIGTGIYAQATGAPPTLTVTFN